MVEARVLASVVEVVIGSHRPASPCPRCGSASAHIQSSYCRTVMDVSCAGRIVRLRVPVRTCRCPVGACSQRVFAERLSDDVRPWARKTVRLVAVLTALEMAVGGRGTETLAPGLGLRVSDPTVLRLLARRPEPAQPRVAVLGVDAFAFRRRAARLRHRPAGSGTASGD